MRDARLLVTPFFCPCSASMNRDPANPHGGVSIWFCLKTDSVYRNGHIAGIFVEKHSKLRFPQFTPSIRRAMESPSNNTHFGKGHQLAQQETTKAWGLLRVNLRSNLSVFPLQE